jgi:hypothetical protein
MLQRPMGTRSRIVPDEKLSASLSPASRFGSGMGDAELMGTEIRSAYYQRCRAGLYLLVRLDSRLLGASEGIRISKGQKANGL